MRLTGISNSGEIIDDLAEMRQKYETEDGGTLELRPYMLCAEPELWKLEKVHAVIAPSKSF